MATRLVAFAITGGKPRNIKTGTDRREPPPATVLAKPATKPVISIRIAFSQSILKDLNRT